MTTIEEPLFTLSAYGESSSSDAERTHEALLGHLDTNANIVGRVALALAHELIDPIQKPADTASTADIRKTLAETLLVSGNGQGIDYADGIWDVIMEDSDWQNARRRMDGKYEKPETVEKNRKVVALHGLAVFAREYAKRQ